MKVVSWFRCRWVRNVRSKSSSRGDSGSGLNKTVMVLAPKPPPAQPFQPCIVDNRESYCGYSSSRDSSRSDGEVAV